MASLAFALLLAMPSANQAWSQEGLWSLGLKAQGTVDLQPGNDYFTGAELGYSNYYLAGHRLQIKASYATTRLEQSFRENILRYDMYLLTPLWHFRRKAIFDPTFQVDAGYARYDLENKAIFGGHLDNDTWLLAAQAGLNLNFSDGAWGFHYHVGYNFITAPNHIIFPGVFGVNLWRML